MNKVKEIFDCIFWAIVILLGILVCFLIFSEGMKNIKLSKRMKENSVCIEINKEIYCKLEYDIKIEYNTGKL